MTQHGWRPVVLRAAAAMLLCAALGAGCGREDAPEPEAPRGDKPTAVEVGTAPAAAVTQAERDKVAKAAQPRKLALVVKTRNNPFFNPMIRAAEADSKALGWTREVPALASDRGKECESLMIQD